MTRIRANRFMTVSRNLLRTVGVLAVLLGAVIGAHAAEEGGNASAEHATEIFKWINFAIVAGVILWVFGKVLPSKFRANAETISSAITKATAAKAAADAQLREAETKLANLQKEVAELRALSERESAAEVERIRAATQSDAKKISAAANAEIEAAERAARLELKAIAAKLAVDGAESLLAQQLTPAAQESLVSNFVKSLEGRPN
jgi:F-type H+-transporting ATPase subunit b